MPKITQNDIRTLKYERESTLNQKTGKQMYPKQIIWDVSPVGFGVRVFPSNKKCFVYKYRNAQGVQRFAELGAVGELTLDQARDKAQKWAALVIDGKDPLEERTKERNGSLMIDLCNRYILDHAQPNKKRSWKEDRARNDLYIIPELGSKQVTQVTHEDIWNLHHKIGLVGFPTPNTKRKNYKRDDSTKPRPKPYAANRVREQLHKMFELAKEWGYLDENVLNPARQRGTNRDFNEKERDAYIKPEYMPIVAKAIENETNEAAKLAIWFCLLTGKRKNEVLKSKWLDIDTTSQTLKIVETKNGETEYLPLSTSVLGILERAKKLRTVGNPYIFPGSTATGHLVNIRKPWLRIRAEAAKNGAEGVDKVTIHGLRHTVGVWLTNHADADLGLVRKIFNHKSLLATKVYAKYKTDTVLEALEQHGQRLMDFAKPQTKKTKAGKEPKPAKSSKSPRKTKAKKA